MPWVRIDEHAMNHPKIAGLSDGSFRLWVQALAHCQNFLTDGLVHPVALRGMSAYSPKRRSELIAAGLWLDRPNEAIQVHDYLQWNDSRDHVIKAREREKDRKRRWREARDGGRDAGRDAGPTVTSPVRGVGGSSVVEPSRNWEGDSKGETQPAEIETAAERAGAFCEWYAETHERIVGVGYIGNARKDYEAALQLVGKFTDQEVRDAAIVWFGMKDKFATEGTRTVSKFASRASDCVLRARAVGV